MSPVPGLPNFRDLGGHAARNGARVRHGLFFRSPAPLGLSPEDAARIAALEPAAIVDFRGRAEAALEGMPAGLAARRVHLPVEPRLLGELRALAERGALTAEAAGIAMAGGYRSYVTEHAAVFADFLALLAVHAGRPVIWHCSAGKDRTGFASALLLTLLGVEAAAVEADYLLTAERWQPLPHHRAAVPEAAQAVLFGVDRAWLAAAMAALAETHGSAEDFAREAIGADRLAALRAASLEPA